MGRCRVVRPAVVRLPLSDGDWIDVKQDLSAGEYVAMLEDMGERKRFTKILTYVVGWSLVGLDEQPLPWDMSGTDDERRAVVASLDKPTVRELIAVLDRHEAAREAALTKKKAMPDAAPALSPTSISPAAVTGLSSGSVS